MASTTSIVESNTSATSPIQQEKQKVSEELVHCGPVSTTNTEVPEAVKQLSNRDNQAQMKNVATSVTIEEPKAPVEATPTSSGPASSASRTTAGAESRAEEEHKATPASGADEAAEPLHDSNESPSAPAADKTSDSCSPAATDAVATADEQHKASVAPVAAPTTTPTAGNTDDINKTSGAEAKQQDVQKDNVQPRSRDSITTATPAPASGAPSRATAQSEPATAVAAAAGTAAAVTTSASAGKKGIKRSAPIAAAGHDDGGITSPRAADEVNDADTPSPAKRLKVNDNGATAEPHEAAH